MFLKNNLGVELSVPDLGIIIPIDGMILSTPLRRLIKSKRICSLLKQEHISAELTEREMADPNIYTILELGQVLPSSVRPPKRNPARAFIRELPDISEERSDTNSDISLNNLPLSEIEQNVLNEIERPILPPLTVPAETFRNVPTFLDLAIKRLNIKQHSVVQLNQSLNNLSNNRGTIPISNIVEVTKEIKSRAKILGNYAGCDVGVFSMGGLGDDIIRANTVRIIRESLPWRDAYITYYHRSASNLLRNTPFIDLDVPLGSRHLINDSMEIQRLANHDIFIDLRYVGRILVSETIPFQSIASGRSWEKTWGKSFFSHPTDIRRIIELTSLHYRELLPKTLGFEFSLSDYTIQFPLEFSLLDQIPKPFLVVSNGTDQTLESNIQTKQIDVDHLSTFCSKLMSLGWNIVEVGLPGVNPLPIVGTYNLVGKTTFDQLCLVLKKSSATICNEGGVAHLSTFLGTPALVAFGPTSSTFWGYPENENLVSSSCSDCWLTTGDWYIQCPKRNHCCMSSLTPKLLYTAFERLCERYKLEPCK